MLIFHSNFIPITTKINTNGVFNSIQIEVDNLIKTVFSKIENYSTISDFKKGEISSRLIFFKSSQEIAIYYTLMELFKKRGLSFRTHIREICYLSNSNEKSVQKTLLILEELRIISVTNDVIFKLEYLNE